MGRAQFEVGSGRGFRRWALPLAVSVLMGGCTEDTTETVAEVEAVCVNDETFFADTVYGEVLSHRCVSCHTAEGAARESSMLFIGIAQPNYIEVNRAIFTDIAGLERNGKSLVLLKPLGQEDHGGGEVLTTDSPAYAILQEFVGRLASPIACASDTTEDSSLDYLELLPPPATLRKASLTLAGRLPTADEIDTVRYGSDEDLSTVLKQILSEEAFIERMQEIFNDRLLTDRYLGGTAAIGLVDDDRYPNLYWYEAETNDSRRNALRDRINEAFAREPLELIAYILREGRPLTEILTADYTMVNAYSATSLGITDAAPPEPYSESARHYFPTRVEGVPHAGVLTTPAFLNRFPTTATNRNRHRSRIFFDRFLATDILTFADRPIDPTISTVHNPTLNDTQCTVCHDTLDPVAGTFQNWDDRGQQNPREEGWFPEMAIPGFGEHQLPYDSLAQALPWLAHQTVQDTRFAIAMTRTVFEAFTGVEALTATETANDPVMRTAYETQSAYINGLATELTEANYDIRKTIVSIIESPYFRATNHKEASDSTLAMAGSAHLLTPEELTRKIDAVTGLPWRNRFDQDDYLLNRYRMLYGGIDSNAVTERLTAPNGIMGSIGVRMATDVACRAITRDLILDHDQRRLLPYVEVSYEPETVDGFAIPEVERLIRENIRYLHLRILGEDLDIDDPEIDHTYTLFYETWKEGKAAIEADTTPSWLPWRCRAQWDFWTNETLPEHLQIRYDYDYTIRAWMATMSYLLSDYRFLYE